MQKQNIEMVFENLAFHIEEGADHSEAAWSKRIHRPLEFFYGK